MEFEMLKKAPAKEGGELLAQLFNLGELDCTLTILPEQLYNICDSNRGNLSMTRLELTGIVSNYIFLNMGGNSETAPECVMSFMYILLATDNFNYKKICSDILTAISTDNTFKYLHDNEITPPAEFLEKLYNACGQWMYEVLMCRYQLAEESRWPEDKLKEFMDTITAKTSYYVQGEGGLNDLLSDLGI